jgi:hypothetical protein
LQRWNRLPHGGEIIFTNLDIFHLTLFTDLVKQLPSKLDAPMTDIPKQVEIVISHDGKSVWVNTETGCAWRAKRIEHLTVDDRRVPDEAGETVTAEAAE